MKQNKNPNEFLERLRGLHDELSSINEKLTRGEQVDESTVEALGTLVSDIARVVDNARGKVEPDPDCPEQSEIMNRIKQLESDHPQVTSFLGQLVDLLGMSGI